MHFESENVHQDVAVAIHVIANTLQVLVTIRTSNGIRRGKVTTAQQLEQV